MPEPVEIDGNIDFSGGMDTSRQTHVLERNQYARGCNVVIPRNSTKLKVRFGIHHQNLTGDQNSINIYNNAKNIQGTGYYDTGKEIVNIKIVDGYVLEFRKLAKRCYKVNVLNWTDRNNPRRTKAWVVAVPGAAIINDGESLPLIVTNSGIRRSEPTGS